MSDRYGEVTANLTVRNADVEGHVLRTSVAIRDRSVPCGQVTRHGT